MPMRNAAQIVAVACICLRFNIMFLRPLQVKPYSGHMMPGRSKILRVHLHLGVLRTKLHVVDIPQLKCWRKHPQPDKLNTTMVTRLLSSVHNPKNVT